MKTDSKINIVHTGISGVPFGRSAAVNRCKAIYSCLEKSKYNVLAINNRPLTSDIPVNSKIGVYNDISYRFTSFNPNKSGNFFMRRMDRIAGLLGEILFLAKSSFKGEIDIICFYPKNTLFELIKYWLYSRFFSVKLVTHYVEYRSSFESRKKTWTRLNDRLFDNYFVHFVDGVIPISDYLTERIMDSKQSLPLIKIPPLVDFNLFQKKNSVSFEDNYFLFVGASGYSKVIDIILDSFALIDNKDYHLYLVLHGGSIEDVRKKVRIHKRSSFIKIYSNLEYSELIEFYMNAKALLIPLLDRLQDKARFPNKIAEYLASGNPVITTNFGEIKSYFTDNMNAFVAETDRVFDYSHKMQSVIDDPENARMVGKMGYKLGKERFDVGVYSRVLDHFFQQVKDSSI